MIDDRKYLLEAFKEAEKSKEEGTYPIGAVIVNSEGMIISRGRNRVFSDCDTTAHAEVDAIRRSGLAMLFKEGPHFLDRFNKISYDAAPFRDLEIRQRTMMAEWSISRGFKDTPWQYDNEIEEKI
ncbi:MAG: deaminase [Bacillota bacterium]